MVLARTTFNQEKHNRNEACNLAQLSFIENPDKGEKSKEKSLEEQIYDRWGDEALEKLGTDVNTNWNKKDKKE